MNIIYLHGLLSSNKSSKTDWLMQEGHTLFNPRLNYKEEAKTVFSDLAALCEQHQIDLIIGSSMGGHLAFHLSNKYKIPSLLFNPSLEKNSMSKPAVIQVENKSILHTIVVGEKDTVVIPSDTLKYLEDRKSNVVHTFEANGHRTPLEVFKKHFKLLKAE
ncbi:MAG: hypothetical protein COB98_09840 [Flavobacteriaceae bacterium]|nr:MAG: hypothetical protein COB98_09840 [Flavobacteriaceae bacterium]